MESIDAPGQFMFETKEGGTRCPIIRLVKK